MTSANEASRLFAVIIGYESVDVYEAVGATEKDVPALQAAVDEFSSTFMNDPPPSKVVGVKAAQAILASLQKRWSCAKSPKGASLADRVAAINTDRIFHAGLLRVEHTVLLSWLLDYEQSGYGEQPKTYEGP